MWQIKDRTPFTSLGYFERDRQGVENWVVSTRAEFAITPGRFPAIAERQNAPNPTSTYIDGDLVADSDFSPFKPRTDVLVQGAASLPDARETDYIPMLVSVAKMEKRLNFYARRILHRGVMGLNVDRSFKTISVPISWSLSYGGSYEVDGELISHEDNSVGRGWSPLIKALEIGKELELPQIEHASRPYKLNGLRNRADCFAPVQPHWRSRRRFAGTYDEEWENNQSPLLPLDFDPQFYQVAPQGQILNLKGGEPVSIINGSPFGPFQFRLPQVILEAKTQIGFEQITTRFRLITVIFDTAKMTLSMVWNTSVPCPGKDDQLKQSTVRLRQMSGVTL